MSINLKVPEIQELKPRLTVLGVGGAGGNAINNMISSGTREVNFVAANTDAQALSKSEATVKIQLGANITKGLGAGSKPEIGKAAAEESVREVSDVLQGSNMAFITCGMGGGTGTGAAPVLARVAKDLGVLTVAVVTKPFDFEGTGRMRSAEFGINELKDLVDTMIIIPNQNLFKISNEQTTFADAFKKADAVLNMGVTGITDLMTMPGIINLDFADVAVVMSQMGRAMMGTGEAEGENRALEASKAAITNPLLDYNSLRGAKGLLINIAGGEDLTLFEVDEAANFVRKEVDPQANLIVGSVRNDELQGRMRVSVVATGLKTSEDDDSLMTSKINGNVQASNTAGQSASINYIFKSKADENVDSASLSSTSQEKSGDHEKEIGGHEEEVSEESTQEEKSSFESVEDHEKELDSLEESVPIPPNDDKEISTVASASEQNEPYMHMDKNLDTHEHQDVSAVTDDSNEFVVKDHEDSSITNPEVEALAEQTREPDKKDENDNEPSFFKFLETHSEEQNDSSEIINNTDSDSQETDADQEDRKTEINDDFLNIPAFLRKKANF